MSDYSRIPKTTIETIDRWVSDGLQPGSFVRAVLCNDLLESFSCADEENSAVLFEIVRYVANRVPAHCWGSEIRFKAWSDYKRAEREKAPMVLELDR